ncbi:MAG: MBOAT family protein [Planctomycetes bacterium]|nr:MBOAT family protein [Planctomycetota bacterium]
MVFTSIDYLIFLTGVFALYWLIRVKSAQNLILLTASYIFYGYIHHWFCILIAISTLTDYFCGLGMTKFPHRKKLLLIFSLLVNLGMLGTFKYFNFFAENFQALTTQIGLNLHPITFKIFLPVGISFYTFQTLSYTIDIYRDKMTPRKNFLDFALFVSFFSQLVAGPIERASRFLPQIETPRSWNTQLFFSAWPLLISGYLKKIVIADNIAVFVDRIYLLDHPSALLLLVGTFGFALQIYTDFSGYTNIARGSARLLGFDLVENFKSPYLAISPSDFWRRWHISFSSWIRDYLYIPLGGSRVNKKWKFALVLIATMALAGLWHGAAWNFVAWGLYHGILVFTYHALGLGGRWTPQTITKTLIAWTTMFSLTIFGWLLFRSSSINWLFNALSLDQFSWGFSGNSLTVAVATFALIAFYSLPLFIMMFLDRVTPKLGFLHAIFYGFALTIIIVLFRDSQQDFIYFQF